MEWEKCNQRAVFHMEGKGSTIKEGRNFISGIVADRAMRKWLEQADSHSPGQMSIYVDELWDELTLNSDEYRITWKTPEDQQDAKETARECVNNLESFLFKNVIPFEYQPEWRFNIKIKIPDLDSGLRRSLVLNGGADIVVRNPETGNYRIFDLKTTRNEKYISGHIMAQLIYYQIALSIAEGISADIIDCAFLTPLCKVQYNPLVISAQDRALLLSRLVRMAHSVWRADVPKLTPDMNECYFCDVKKFCPRFCSPSTEVDGKHVASFVDAAKLRKEAKGRTDEE